MNGCLVIVFFGLVWDDEIEQKQNNTQKMKIEKNKRKLMKKAGKKIS
jgi:hypothetical protein